jgi:hypothetical protein
MGHAFDWATHENCCAEARPLCQPKRSLERTNCQKPEKENALLHRSQSMDCTAKPEKSIPILPKTGFSGKTASRARRGKVGPVFRYQTRSKPLMPINFVSFDWFNQNAR